MNTRTLTVSIFCMCVNLVLTGCGVRDEKGNINPSQIRQNVIDTHENLVRLNDHLDRGAAAVNEGAKLVMQGAQAVSGDLSQAATELSKPKPPPANVTQPEF